MTSFTLQQFILTDLRVNEKGWINHPDYVQPYMPGESGDGVGFPTGFGDWWRS